MTRSVQQQIVMLSGRPPVEHAVNYTGAARLCDPGQEDGRTASRTPAHQQHNASIKSSQPAKHMTMLSDDYLKNYFGKTVLRCWEKSRVQERQPVLDHCAAGRPRRFFHNCHC